MSRIQELFLCLIVLSTLACAQPNASGLQYELRCGMSQEATLATAKRYGYRECSVPTAKGQVPDYGCHGGDRWVAFWFENSRLTTYQFGDSNADDCGQESG